MPFNFADFSLTILFVIMALAGTLVWYAGSRLAGLVDKIAERTGIGQAFAGMLLLGGITSLPELVTASTASLAGNPLLSINDLLGTSSINILLLVVGDIVYGKGPLTHQTQKPAPLMQGVLGMMLMAGVAIAISIGDTNIPVLGTGILSLLLAVACVQALRISSRFEGSNTWKAQHPPENEPADDTGRDYSNLALGALTAGAGLAIMVGGASLALAGDAIAEKSGLGTSIVGFALVGFCTSLPELSSVIAALKMRRYQLAIGDIFGTNLFNIQIIFIADLFYRGGPVLDTAGTFEVTAACLAVVMTGIFVVGMLERRDKTIWRMGMDSALALLVFVGGLAGLSMIA
ncbi:sodium:calcium antiporter [Rhizorhapis sp. SPR117]|uniref:sodium:calcium antiporter n=1 Tax=Rhizorhapis sp. SPR117 TaxID=2912611 RepID=UPI001F15C713|nr:sodium:calcium antiporter [Rhizorhapis sp. SPR117]